MQPAAQTARRELCPFFRTREKTFLFQGAKLVVQRRGDFFSPSKTPGSKSEYKVSANRARREASEIICASGWLPPIVRKAQKSSFWNPPPMLKGKCAFIVSIWRAAKAAAACHVSNDRAERSASTGAWGITTGASVRAGHQRQNSTFGPVESCKCEDVLNGFFY
ncbi:hypothetical protein ACJMK2_004793 [Sinanodonta woodiana]|uniref:Uncharacterized protein n=1 Tax=Sinanodonta woodiana TaxID=1069815 RepID=A0ABD3VNS8_SINWO